MNSLYHSENSFCHKSVHTLIAGFILSFACYLVVFSWYVFRVLSWSCHVISCRDVDVYWMSDGCLDDDEDGRWMELLKIGCYKDWNCLLSASCTIGLNDFWTHRTPTLNSPRGHNSYSKNTTGLHWRPISLCPCHEVWQWSRVQVSPQPWCSKQQQE